MERAGEYTLKLKSQHSPFEALLESIIYQQLHGKAAAAILKRLLTLFGEIHPSPEHLLGASDDMLRSAGLSGSKAKALRDLAAKTIDGTVPTLVAIRRMPDDEIVDRLTQVRGIGPWTVEMLALHGQGRFDQLPAGDLGLLKYVGRRLSGGDPRACAAEVDVRTFFAPYGRWCGLAAVHVLSL